MAYTHQSRIFVVGAQLRSLAALDVVAVRHAVTVRQFPGRQDCLQQLRKTPCDLLIIDLATPAETLDMLTQARQLWPWQSSLVLVEKGQVSHAVSALKAGAADCLEKPICQDHLLSAIEQELRRTAALRAANVTLTQMELTIVHLILAGKTSKDIAHQLNRSKRTIDVHREKIYHKLGVSSPLGMVKWAISAGVVDWQGNR